jgi:hypothetical protein
MAEHRTLDDVQDPIQLRVKDTEMGGNYKLTIQTEDFSNLGLSARLVDLVTNTSVPISLNGAVSEYSFVPSATQNAVDRFSIVFDKLLSKNAINSNDVYVYPNPFTGSSFQIHFENIPIGLYKYDIINTLGQVVDHGNINLNTTNSTLTTNNTLQSGIYVLRLVDENNNKYSVKLSIKQ